VEIIFSRCSSVCSKARVRFFVRTSLNVFPIIPLIPGSEANLERVLKRLERAVSKLNLSYSQDY
jgi:hypothetical protein